VQEMTNLGVMTGSTRGDYRRGTRREGTRREGRGVRDEEGGDEEGGTRREWVRGVHGIKTTRRNELYETELESQSPFNQPSLLIHTPKSCRMQQTHTLIDTA